MTGVYITIDTEYSSGLAARLGPGACDEVFDRSVRGKTQDGEVGIHYQMDVMDAHGLKGVFFVDPLPALLWGERAVARMVEPILKRGHEVQLHLHTEWLALAGDANPLRGRTGDGLCDFTEDEQVELIAIAREYLVRAGAPAPTAFRAGNYAADNATLRALKRCGIRYDSSHTPGIKDRRCRIAMGPDNWRTALVEGTIEVPCGSIRTLRGQRHAQITAISAWETRAALRHAARRHIPSIHLVSHSFELMCRERRRTNPLIVRRFARVCEAIAGVPGVSGATFCSRPPRVGEATGVHDMPLSETRAAMRMAEQALSNALYGRA